MKLPKGWKTKAIGDIAEVAGGIQKGPHREASANPVRYLTVAHVQRNRLLLDDPRFFEVTPAELQRWRLIKGDLLIIEGNGSADQIGRTALFRGEISDCVHQNHVIRIRPNKDEVDGEYLNSLMNSSDLAGSCPRPVKGKIFLFMPLSRRFGAARTGVG